MLRFIVRLAAFWKAGAMMAKNNVTEMLAVTIRLHGPDAAAIRKAAEMFGKSPDQYCAEYLKWRGLMDVEGVA
jgi:hypothetical protein